MYSQDEIETTKLDTLIDEIIMHMSGVECDSEEYAKMADQLTKLYKLKQIETELKLKTNDQDIKDRELYANIEVKERDSQAKLKETNSNIEAKKEESVLRREELDAKTRLMDVEIESKKDEIEKRKRVSPDTLALIGANIVGIVMIIGHERANVIASKALGFVSKLK